MRFFLGKKAPNLNPFLATGTTSFCGQLFPSTFPLKLVIPTHLPANKPKLLGCSVFLLTLIPPQMKIYKYRSEAFHRTVELGK